MAAGDHRVLGGLAATCTASRKSARPCPADQAAAQAPDGRPLLCLGDQGWQAGFFTGSGFWPT